MTLYRGMLRNVVQSLFCHTLNLKTILQTEKYISDSSKWDCEKTDLGADVVIRVS